MAKSAVVLFLSIALWTGAAHATVNLDACSVPSPRVVAASADTISATGIAQWLVTSTEAGVQVDGVQPGGTVSVSMIVTPTSDGSGNTSVLLNGHNYLLDSDGHFLGPTSPSDAVVVMLIAMNQDLAGASDAPELPDYCPAESVSALRCSLMGVGFAVTATFSIISATSVVGAVGGFLATSYALDSVLSACGAYDP